MYVEKTLGVEGLGLSFNWKVLADLEFVSELALPRVSWIHI
jgi:hypothetical protein